MPIKKTIKKRLDLIEGDYVRSKDGSICRVMDVLPVGYKVMPVEINGFGHEITRMYWAAYKVDNFGKYDNRPSAQDIVSYLTIKDGFFGVKFKDKSLPYYDYY